jgi:hypothetical protein
MRGRCGCVKKGPGGPPPGPARRTALGGAAQELRFPLGRTLPQCATSILSANGTYL